jgi:hypothetical protein
VFGARVTVALAEPCRRSKQWESSLSEGEGPESKPVSLPGRNAPFHDGEGDPVTCLLKRGCRVETPLTGPLAVSYVGRRDSGSILGGGAVRGVSGKKK